jgi:hypothetical protein
MPRQRGEMRVPVGPRLTVGMAVAGDGVVAGASVLGEELMGIGRWLRL